VEQDLNLRRQGQQTCPPFKVLFLWAGLDLNQRRQSQQIYSLPQLTALVPTHVKKTVFWQAGLQSAPVDRFGIHPSLTVNS
jgi:hypothetical protein